MSLKRKEKVRAARVEFLRKILLRMHALQLKNLSSEVTNRRKSLKVASRLETFHELPSQTIKRSQRI